MAKATMLWSEGEIAILIDAYLQIESGKLSRVEAAQQISTILRNRAKSLRMEIDDNFRSKNVIYSQLTNLGNEFNNDKPLTKLTPLFVDMINQYKTNRPYFDVILNIAKKQAGIIQKETIQSEITQETQEQAAQQKVSVSLQERFLAWLSAKVSPTQMYDFYMAYVKIEKIFLNSQDYPLLEKPFFETVSLKVISEIKTIIDSSSKLKSNYFGSYKKMKSAIQYYYDFLKENEAEFAQNEVEISPVGKISSEKKETEKNTTVEKTKSNLLTIDWNNIENQNFYYTKPLYFIYFGREYTVNSWSNLYIQIVRCLNQDYENQISCFIGSSLFKDNRRIDITNSINKYHLTKPGKVEENLFIETNLSSNHIILRINKLLQLCGIDNKNVVTIYYKENSKNDNTLLKEKIKDTSINSDNLFTKEKNKKISLNDADEQLLEYIKIKEVEYEDYRAKGDCLWLIGGHELDNFVKACEQRFDITFHYQKDSKGKKFKEVWYTTKYAKVARPLPRPTIKKAQLSPFEVKSNVDMKDNIDIIDNSNNANNIDVKDSIAIKSPNNTDSQLLEYIKSQNIDYEDLRAKGGCLWLIGGRDLDDFVSCCQQRFNIVFAYCQYNINPLELKGKKFKEAWYTLEYAEVVRPLPCPIPKEVQSSPFEVNIDSINKSDVLGSDNNLSETNGLGRTDNLDDIDDLKNTDNANNNNFSKTDHLNKTDIEYHIEPKKIPLPIKQHYMVIEKRITLDLDDLLLEDLDNLEELEELETSNTEISHVEINDLEASNTETNNSEENDFEENNVEISHVESDNSTLNDLNKLVEQEQKPENPYEQILTECFEKGLRRGYVGLKNFINRYNERFNENINASDKSAQYKIEKKLLQVGISHGNYIFSVDSLASAEVKQKLIDFIQKSFGNGKNVIYYKALLDEFQKELPNINNDDDNEELLKKYLQCILKDYYFKKEYFSNQEEVSFDLSDRITEVILDYGGPIPVQRIYQAFPDIPEERIKDLISEKRDFIWNKRKRDEECFHISMFDLNEQELDEISDIITKAISENNSISIDNLFTALENTNIMERFEQYSKIGKRDALAYYLSDKFNFGANIITSKSSAGLQNGFEEFAKKHSTFTIEDLKELKKELGAQEINFKAIYQYAMRINETNFVSKEQANFDIQTTDAAISQYCVGDYVALKEINFAFFPETDFSWNTYLLEQYVAHFSAAYKLINNRYYVEDCVGAIVKKGSNININKFDDLIRHILKNDFFSENSQEVLNYLYEKGYLVRPVYAGIDNIIARVKREKRG